MLVSVVVLTFNRKNMLKETIDSILSQTFKDFELIIVDNCSTDGTEDFVLSYKDPRIKYFKNPNNGIIAVNLNYGIAKAQGKYIALCDDDDLWLPTKLEKQIDILNKENDIGMVCTNGITFNELGKEDIHITKKRNSNYISQKETLMKNIIIQSSAIIRKDILEEFGFFDVSPEYFTAEEFELWLKIMSKYNVYLIEEPLVKYRTHSGVFRSKGIKHLNICKKIVDDLYKKGFIPKTNYHLFLARHYVFYTANITKLNQLYHKLNLKWF